MRLQSLHVKFLACFAVVIAVLFGAYHAWGVHTQNERAEREMLETARVLSLQMESVWDFMEMNERQFKTGPGGRPILYCVVAAKSISHLFTESSNYSIRYTNEETRKSYDSPDNFELGAIAAMKEDPSLREYYAVAEGDGGQTVFRYVRPVYITESCLKCHGEPAGELDVTGYAKEGLKVGDLAGVASIVIPAETFMKSGAGYLNQSSLVFAAFLLLAFAAMFLWFRHFVTNPLGRLEAAASQVERGDFCINVGGIDIDRSDEIGSLSRGFRSMSERLGELYADLESQVEDRTHQLAAANAELMKQRASLEELNERLQADAQYKSDFLSIMSHELRTPLTSILAFADIWKNRYEPRDEKESVIVREIALNSQVILSMVNNILEMARFDAGKSELHVEMVDVYDLVMMTRDMNRSLAEKKEIRFEVELNDDLPMCVLDREKVHRILENLVSNAIKFTDHGGEVVIGAEFDGDREDLVLSVRDSGRGICEEDLGRIFESFVQGRGGGSHVGGGSGLGLAVVGDLVKLHGGRVEVESTPGIGSTFTVLLPQTCANQEVLE